MDQGDKTLWIKFTGEDLDIRSVPIYELGEVFVALQRIIHKTYLFKEDRLRKHAQLTQIERRDLSLQIQERRKSSDLFALIPFATDAALQAHLTDLIKTGLGSLTKYALKSVFGGEEPQPQKDAVTQSIQDGSGSMLTGAIYAETVQITNHIYNIGGIERIELATGSQFTEPAVSFTDETQKYVRNLAQTRYFGERTEISGNIGRFDPDQLEVEVRTGPKQNIKVHLRSEDFHTIRYGTAASHRVRFQGRPVLRLNKGSSDTFHEFEADSIIV